MQASDGLDGLFVGGDDGFRQQLLVLFRLALANQVQIAGADRDEGRAGPFRFFEEPAILAVRNQRFVLLEQFVNARSGWRRCDPRVSLRWSAGSASAYCRMVKMLSRVAPGALAQGEHAGQGVVRQFGDGLADALQPPEGDGAEHDRNQQHGGEAEDDPTRDGPGVHTV